MTASDTVRLEPCEVTQEDREAAADLHRATYGTQWSGAADVDARFRAGELDDDKKVQAFARHRLNTRPLSIPKGEEVERLARDAARKLMSSKDYPREPSEKLVRAFVDFAAAMPSSVGDAELLRAATIRVHTENSEFGQAHCVELAFDSRDDADKCFDLLSTVSETKDEGIGPINLDHRYLIKRQSDGAFVGSTDDLGLTLPMGHCHVDTLGVDGLGTKDGRRGIRDFLAASSPQSAPQVGGEPRVARTEGAPATLYGEVGMALFKADFAGLRIDEKINAVGNAAFAVLTNTAPLVEALRAVEAAMLNGGDGETGDYGWNIGALNKARPFIRQALSQCNGKGDRHG